jgi:tRNA(Arg) A34 adenosine deaminase TadA
MDKLTLQQQEILIELMKNSARKGNLANAAIAIDSFGNIIESSESLVVSNTDATAHAERLLVEKLGKKESNHYINSYTIITVVQPCLMCLSASSQAGIKEIEYIIKAEDYIAQIPWMSDIRDFDKHKLGLKMLNPVKLTYLTECSPTFKKVFEIEMKKHLVRFQTSNS